MIGEVRSQAGEKKAPKHLPAKGKNWNFDYLKTVDASNADRALLCKLGMRDLVQKVGLESKHIVDKK